MALSNRPFRQGAGKARHTAQSRPKWDLASRIALGRAVTRQRQVHEAMLATGVTLALVYRIAVGDSCSLPLAKLLRAHCLAPHRSQSGSSLPTRRSGNTNREPNRFYGQFVHRISVVVDWSRLWWTVAVMLVGWTRRQLIRALSLSGTRAPQLDRSLQPCGRPVRSALPSRHQVWGCAADARASEAAGSLAVSFAAWHSPKVF